MIHLLTVAVFDPCGLPIYWARCGYKSGNWQDFAKVKYLSNATRNPVESTVAGVDCPDCLQEKYHTFK